MAAARDDAAVADLLRAAARAGAAGDRAGAARAFAQVLARAPDHPEALNALGMAALPDDPRRAADLFARAAAADAMAPPLWMNLATAHRRLGDVDGERAALGRVLALDQRHLMANVRIAELHERAGEDGPAAFRWGGVAQLLHAMPARDAALDGLLELAQSRVTARTERGGATLDTQLAPLRAGHAPAARHRFDVCVDAMLGRRRIFRHEPHGLHFPFLPADEFFDRAHFPWLPALEAETPHIRRELEALLGAVDPGFAPYVAMEPGAPANKWTALDRSDAWSSRYLFKYGVPQEEALARCPRTAAALANVPLADVPGKGPTAFFSILRPGARLPAHSGVSNIRAIVHLPLIVPPGCGFRVGGETREWVEGEAFAFDDTIEHEAWNEGDARRAVLILDVWNPYLTAAERDMLRALFATLAGLEDVPPGMGAVAE